MATTPNRVTVVIGDEDAQLLSNPAVPAAKVDGPLSAVLLASGIGTFALGLLTTWAEASTSFRTDLQLDDGVGPLSGKTVYATAVFLISWLVLGYLYRRRDGTLRTATIAFVVLTALGFLGTFPTFFQAFAD
jgi:hypothetical protein